MTRRLAHTLILLAPEELNGRLIDIGGLPLYNEDFETDTPPDAWTQFRQEIRNSDAVLFVTPEYNRSVPASLKNAIDVGSAPHGQNVFEGKAAGIVSASSGRLGAFGANHHLRQSLVFLNMPIMQQPELYLGGSSELYASSGRLANAEVEDMLRNYMTAYAHHVALHQ